MIVALASQFGSTLDAGGRLLLQGAKWAAAGGVLLVATLLASAWILSRVARQGRPDAAQAIAARIGALIVTPVQWIHDGCRTTRSWLADRRAGSKETVFRGRRGPWAVIGAVVATVIWLFTVRALLGLDIEAFQELGHTDAQSARLAVLLVASASAIGLLLTEVVGMTRITPMHGARASARLGVAAAAVILFVVVNLGINRDLGEARASQVFRGETTEAETLAAVAGDDAELQGLAADLEEDAASRHSTNSRLDPLLGMVAAGLEAATSWGPLALVVMLIAFVGFLLSSVLRVIGAVAHLIWSLLSGAVGLMQDRVTLAASDDTMSWSAQHSFAAQTPPPRTFAAEHPETARQGAAPDDVSVLEDLWSTEPAPEPNAAHRFPPAF